MEKVNFEIVNETFSFDFDEIEIVNETRTFGYPGFYLYIQHPFCYYNMIP